MKKVGIVSCYYVKNYGSMLQAYAVQKMIENKGIECENIQYVKKNQLFVYAKKLCNKNIRKVQFKNFKRKIIGKLNYEKYGKNFKIRSNKFEQFTKEHIKISKPYLGYDALKNGSNDYRAFVLGSDQLWHPDNIENHYFTMEFIDDNIPKITYAPSFGVSEIPEKQKEATKIYLNRIQHISVREETGKKIVKELTGKDVPVVLDPTFMLSINDWENMQPKEPIYAKKYIFCYFLGNNPEHRKIVKRIKEKTGYDIVALPHIDELVKEDEQYADVKMYDVGPAEMINLIKNAEIICTDSFHCTAFSIMYEKEFYTFNRFKEGQKASTNTRLKSILSLLGLEDRLYTDYDKVLDKISIKIDYCNTREKLKEMKEKSDNYLENALKQEGII